MKYIIAALAIVLTACSVQEAKVANQPPVIPTERKVEMSSLYGTLTFGTVTMFFWPKWSEQEALVKAEQVKKLSIEADTLELGLPKLEAELAKAVDTLAQEGCAPYMTNAEVVRAGAPVATIWVENVPDTEKPRFEKCVEIENGRLATLGVYGANFNRFGTVSADIQALVDANGKGEFWKVVPTNANTKFVIARSADGGAPKVDIRMRGLFDNKNTRVETTINPQEWEANRPKKGPLTDAEKAVEENKKVFLRATDVKYDTRMHSLSFKVSGNPEWGITETAEFSLVRYDELTYLGEVRSRFGGDVIIKKDGKVVSKGSIMIRGPFEAAE